MRDDDDDDDDDFGGDDVLPLAQAEAAEQHSESTSPCMIRAFVQLQRD